MHTQTAIRTDAARRTVASAPRSLAVSTRVHEGALDADALDQSMQLMGAVMAYPRNSEIFGDNESADYLYKVVSGSVRTYKILCDGRRQVGGFYLAGDIFGLEFTDEHTL